MSFDLAAFSAARKLDADAAGQVYSSLCDGRPWQDLLPADPRVEAFHGELAAKWPTLSELDSRACDDSPWAGNIEHSAGHVIVSVVFPASAEVATAFCAMAMRHGIYAYDPQAGELYDPSSAGDREGWLALQAEEDRNQAAASSAPRWQARGGARLAHEVVTALLPPALGLRPVPPQEDLLFAFGISAEVEGRLWAAVRGQGRRLQVQSVLVGAVHKGLQDGYKALSGLPGPRFQVQRPARSLGRSAWNFEADDVDPAAFSDLVASARAQVEWASSLTGLGRVLGELMKRDGRAELRPVALGMTGRLDEAAEHTERLARAYFRGDWEGPDEPGAAPHYPSRELAFKFKAYTIRLHERFGVAYREHAAPLLSDLGAAGLPPGGLGALADGGDSRAAQVLVEALGSVTYLPLKRDVLTLLGRPWAKPAAAVPLAREFEAMAGAQVADSTLLVAAAESFFEVCDETAIAECSRIASHPGYGKQRAPFVSALGEMHRAAGEATPVLAQLLGEPAMARYAMPALANLRAVSALPDIERLIGSPLGWLSDLATRTRDRLVCASDAPA